MTKDEWRASARELVGLHERFAPLFGRKEAQAQSLVYLNGLLLGQERKSAEPMALAFGHPDDDGLGQNQVLALQRFLTYSPWDYQDIQREIQTVFAERLDPATAVPPKSAGRGRTPTRPKRDNVHSVQAVAESLPVEAWHTYQLRDGACGPLVFQFAAVRVWAVRHRGPGPAIWLVIRRALGPDAETKYYVSNAPADTPLPTFALVSGCRFRVEEFFQEGKSYLGMAQYEARAWSSWHHHMSLVALAHLFVTLTRLRLKKKTPGLTLDMALRLLRSVLPRPELTVVEAMAIMNYHLRRNRIARKSHKQSWLNRHKKVEFKVLL